MMKKAGFPFCAIVKQNDIKEAIILNLINPKIGGVLIDGPGGTAKSMLAESVKDIADRDFVKLPLNISEDRLTGSIDLEKTFESGEVCKEKGVLERADGGILFIDDVDLLTDNISDILINVLSTGELILERDGISDRNPCNFIMIGTMNSEKNQIRKGIVDYFGLYAKAEVLNTPADRTEIMKTIDAYDNRDLQKFDEWEAQTEDLKKLISEARERMKEIDADEEILSLIVKKVLEAGAEGHRADMIMKEAVKAIAAFHERTEINEEDIDEAAYFVLPHRMRPGEPPQEDHEEEEPEHDHEEEQEPDDNEDNTDREQNEDRENQSEETEEDNQDSDNDNDKSSGRFKSIPKVFETGEAFTVMDFSHEKDRKTRKGSGRRTQTKTDSTSGRYIHPTQKRKNDDLAIDATIRAAAPHQTRRQKNGMAIAIKDSDIREKVRQKKISNLLIFVVDASGSMGAVRRMTEAKAAVLSLLKDAYVKRDKVGMVTFSGEGAQVVLPPTRSTERGYRLLEDIKTGGKTPLNAGIEKGLRVIENQLRQNPDIMPMLIVITDGRGNLSIDSSKKPSEELLEIGEMVSKEKRLDTMVIDIENNSMMSFGIAGKLAKAMNAKYYRLDELKSDRIEEIVRREKVQ